MPDRTWTVLVVEAEHPRAGPITYLDDDYRIFCASGGDALSMLEPKN